MVEPDVAVRVADPGIPAIHGLPDWASRHTDNAWVGLFMVLALTAVGSLLLWSGGGPAWTSFVFLAIGVAGSAAYYLSVFRYFRGLERKLPQNVERWTQLEGKLIASFDQLGAGDLVRAGEHTSKLPPRLARVSAAASNALSSLAQQIQDSSIEVASAADAVNQVASDLASGSSEQAASVVEITAAMEELARTASQIAESATRQAELASKAEASGDSGSEAVFEAVAGVEEVQKRISAIASRADTLGTRSKEIYRVLELINEIAQETHILSLNAAIEAVAAGAEGRRFSVVAEEVRHLAQRSQESVESVRNLLDEFSGSIRATIVATEEGSKEAARVLERSRAAASAIDELRQASGDTSRVSRQISMATQQQNAASDEVVMTLREVSLVVQRMTGGLKNLSGTADRLNSLGLTIQLLAQSFHLDSPRSLKHMVEEWGKELERAATSTDLEETLDRLVQQTQFIELGYFADTTGYLVALCYNRAAVGNRPLLSLVQAREIDMTQRPWYRSVSRERRASLTQPYESLQNTGHVFTVAAPVYGRDRTFKGVIGVDINVGGWTRI